jgi:microcystin-dependent protein
MGGTSANRLTNQSGGLNGDTLGAMGGSETHTLTEAQLPTITPAGTNSHVPAHRHFVANGDSGAFSSLMNSNQLKYFFDPGGGDTWALSVARGLN